jgi:tRNA (pseudouridine54-N1)-methyltransferase
LIPAERGVRRFIVLGQKTTASADFLIDDVPGTSGRLDILVRCVRAALLYSHGLRRDTIVYLVLLGGPLAPRTMRLDGAGVKFIRPDERSLATLVKKTLANRADEDAEGFVEVKPGIAIAKGGLDVVLADLGEVATFVLDEQGSDFRELEDRELRDAAFFVGDHLGFDDVTHDRLEAIGAHAIRVGPVSLHAEDVITLVVNELDRRA